MSLVALPSQPDGVPWPTADWPRGEPIARVDALVDEVFDDSARYETTYAAMVVVGGRVIAERYGNAKPRWADEPEPVGATTLLRSWSMAKSILHAAVGLLVGDGALALDVPAAVPEWHVTPDDPRAAITLQHMLEMRDGLEWCEDYVDDRVSDVIHMLFGAGMADVASYAAARPLAHPPGTVFNYSSGTSNIVARLAGDASPGVHGRAGMEQLLGERLFGRIGMRSATPARSSGRRTSTPPHVTSRASACCTCATAAGTARACCQRDGSITAVGRARSTPTDRSTAPTGGSWATSTARSTRAATRANASSSCPRSTR